MKVRLEKTFEQGPIRPPSEANSLFLRVNRNCAWNKCLFCPVYKNETFSLRKREDVLFDIDMLSECIRIIKSVQKETSLLWKHLYPLQLKYPEISPIAFSNAFRWSQNYRKNIFLQDASIFSTPFQDLAAILAYVKEHLHPENITAYACAKDVCSFSIKELMELRDLGLTQIHMGLESGSNKVLSYMAKGAPRIEMIIAGQNLKKAGITLCVYVMPGLGGKELSDEHATLTASAIKEITPDVVRLRTLSIIPSTPLWKKMERHEFISLAQIDTVREIRGFLEQIENTNTILVSDHIANILESLAGQLPKELNKLKEIADIFLAWPVEKQTAFVIGRRAGIVRHLEDINSSKRKEKITLLMDLWKVTPQTLDAVSIEMMRQYM